MSEISQIIIKGTSLKVFKSFFGTESVFVNEVLVSKKWSLFGTKHSFSIENEPVVLQTILNLTEVSNNCVLISRSGQDNECHPIKSKSFATKRFFIGLVLGVIIYLIFLK